MRPSSTAVTSASTVEGAASTSHVRAASTGAGASCASERCRASPRQVAASRLRHTSVVLTRTLSWYHRPSCFCVPPRRHRTPATSRPTFSWWSRVANQMPKL